MITKQSVLMNRRATASDYTKWFSETLDKPSGHPRNIVISRSDWADMGSPEVITVTVMPGDHLNPPENMREYKRDHPEVELRMVADPLV